MKCKYCGCELAVVAKVPNLSFSENRYYIDGTHRDSCPMNWSNVRLGYDSEMQAKDSLLGISNCNKKLCDLEEEK